MQLTPQTRIGDIAARYPLATRVFARHDIDFCCGGGRPLEDVCDERGLSTAEVLEEVRRSTSDEEPSERRWDQAPAASLVRHLVDDHHEPLREELPRLETMARKVVRAHGSRDPERLGALLDTIVRLREELEAHMEVEERELFPAILADGPIRDDLLGSLTAEHSETGAALERLRQLTDGYRVPEGACTTWRALWHGLAALETSLHRHVHLENNVLFARLGDTA